MMALLQAKGRLESCFPGRFFGSATTVANGSGLPGNFTGLRNMIAGEGIADQRTAIPNGHLAPSAWFLPQVAGGMSSRGEAVITVAADGNAAQGRNMTGTAAITFDATGSAAAIAALAGSASITFTGAASASAVFSLEGSSTITFSASGAGTAIASISGTAAITISGLADPLTTVWMVAEPIASELTADAIAAAVWASEPTTTPLTAGEIAAAVMASGVEAGMTMTQAMRLITAALAGKSVVEGTSVSFRDVNDTKNRITATVSSDGDRTSVTLDST